MGEAKRRRAHAESEARELLRLEVEKWDRPASQWEADLVADVEGLPRVTVHRATDAQIALMKMEPKECHVNVGSYVDMDPTGDTRMVTGWWKLGDRYLHHSVVGRADGVFFCITPMMSDFRGDMEFIPDDKIEWREVGDARHGYRNGREIGPGLRADPERARRVNAVVREALAAGKPVDEIMNLPGMTL